jgi:O-antigen/teichoic acid export membrane protein
MNVAMATFMASLAWWVEPRLRLYPGYISRTVIRDIYSVGIWFSALSIARALTLQVGPTIVGFGLGNRLVATFTIARQLTTYVSMVMLSLTQIAAPRAAVLFFSQQADEQKTLFIGGGRAAIALALFFVGGFLSLGSPFISLWQGGRQDAAYIPLVILLLGEVFPMGQGVTYSVLTAMGRHRQLAQLALCEGMTSLCLAAAAIRPFGMLGVCIAIAISSFVFRGLCPWLLACRLFNVRPSSYLREAVVPISAVWVITVAGMSLLAIKSPPQGWATLIGYGALYAALYLLASAFVILRRDAFVPLWNFILRGIRII